MSGMGDFMSMMKNAKEMAEKARRMREDLGARTVSASSGAGLVRVRMNGLGELVGLELDRAAVNPDDPEMLADLILGAVAEAKRKAGELHMEMARELTGGVDLSALGLEKGDLF